MGKGKRLKRLRKRNGAGFAAQASDAFTRNFQKELKNSELWDQIVAEFGEECALEILSECKAQVKSNEDFE